MKLRRVASLANLGPRETVLPSKYHNQRTKVLMDRSRNVSMATIVDGAKDRKGRRGREREEWCPPDTPDRPQPLRCRSASTSITKPKLMSTPEHYSSSLDSSSLPAAEPPLTAIRSEPPPPMPQIPYHFRYAPHTPMSAGAARRAPAVDLAHIFHERKGSDVPRNSLVSSAHTSFYSTATEGGGWSSETDERAHRALAAALEESVVQLRANAPAIGYSTTTNTNRSSMQARYSYHSNSMPKSGDTMKFRATSGDETFGLTFPRPPKSYKSYKTSFPFSTTHAAATTNTDATRYPTDTGTGTGSEIYSTAVSTTAGYRNQQQQHAWARRSSAGGGGATDTDNDNDYDDDDDDDAEDVSSQASTVDTRFLYSFDDAGGSRVKLVGSFPTTHVTDVQHTLSTSILANLNLSTLSAPPNPSAHGTSSTTNTNADASTTTTAQLSGPIDFDNLSSSVRSSTAVRDTEFYHDLASAIFRSLDELSPPAGPGPARAAGLALDLISRLVDFSFTPRLPETTSTSGGVSLNTALSALQLAVAHATALPTSHLTPGHIVYRYREVAQQHVGECLLDTLTHGDQLSLIEWASLDENGKSWRRSHEKLLVKILGCAETVLEEEEVQAVESIAKGLEGCEWLRKWVFSEK